MALDASFRFGFRLPLLQRTERTHNLQERQIGDAVAIGKAGALDVARLLPGQLLRELIQQTALPQSRLADHRDPLAVPLLCLRPGVPESLQFEVASDKARQA